MDYINFLNKYEGQSYDIFAFAYFKALEDLVGEDKAKQYIEDSIKEKALVENAAKIIDKLTEKPPISEYYAPSKSYKNTSPKSYTSTYYSQEQQADWEDYLNSL